MASKTNDPPSYSESNLTSNTSNTVHEIETTYYIADEMVPFSFQLIRDYDINKRIIYEIRDGDELINVLDSFESSNYSGRISFIHNVNNSIGWNTDSVYATSGFHIPYNDKSSNQHYKIFKTFLTFRYTPVPTVKCYCGILFGRYLPDTKYTFWRTNLSLDDSINLMKNLVPYNDAFHNEKESGDLENKCYFIGLSMIGKKHSLVGDYRCSTPKEVLAVLEKFKKLSPQQHTWI